MSSAPARRSALRPSVAIGLLLLAALAWGVIFAWQSRTAPAQRHIDAAIEYTHRRLGKEAEQEWRAALRLEPNNADAWEQLGELYFSTHDWPAAVEPYRQLLRLRPNTPHLYERLAVATLRDGDEVAALKYAEEELKRDPNNLGALTIAATLLQDTGDDAKRLEYLRRLAKLRPDDLDTLSPLAEALTEQHRCAEARPVLEHILQLDPNNLPAYELRGEGWMEESTSPQARAQTEADLQHALQLNPQAPVAHFYLGKLYQSEGKFALALPHLEQAAKAMPDRVTVFFDLAGLYRQMGRTQDAERALSRFQTLRRQADHISQLDERCTLEPNNFDAHRERGLIALRQGDFRRARFYLHRAQELRPDDTITQRALQQLASLMQTSLQPLP